MSKFNNKKKKASNYHAKISNFASEKKKDSL